MHLIQQILSCFSEPEIYCVCTYWPRTSIPPKCEGEEKLRKESDLRKSSKHIRIIICHIIALESNPYIQRNLLSLIPVSSQLKALRPLRVFCFIVTFLIKRSEKYAEALWPRWQSIFLPHGRFCLTSPKNPSSRYLSYLGAKHNASPTQQRYMTTQIKTWGEYRLFRKRTFSSRNEQFILDQRWHHRVICKYISDLFKKVFWTLANWHISVGELTLEVGKSTSYVGEQGPRSNFLSGGGGGGAKEERVEEFFFSGGGGRHAWEFYLISLKWRRMLL